MKLYEIFNTIIEPKNIKFTKLTKNEADILFIVNDLEYKLGIRSMGIQEKTNSINHQAVTIYFNTKKDFNPTSEKGAELTNRYEVIHLMNNILGVIDEWSKLYISKFGKKLIIHNFSFMAKREYDDDTRREQIFISILKKVLTRKGVKFEIRHYGQGVVAHFITPLVYE